MLKSTMSLAAILQLASADVSATAIKSPVSGIVKELSAKETTAALLTSTWTESGGRFNIVPEPFEPRPVDPEHDQPIG